jgi:hypothetical protein
MNEMIKNPLSSNPIAERPKTQPQSAMVSVESQRVIAEVQAAMMIARTNPRDPIRAMDNILNACTRPSLAEVAIYQYARGGTDISGPSIRLAEAIAQSWGNIKTSVRELEQTNGISTIQTIAWDLETGYQCDKVFQVPHVRHTKKGDYQLTDPRDIYENTANQGARRLRACILALIPGDITEAAQAQCELTLKTSCDMSAEAIAKTISGFTAMGVSKTAIEKRIQRRMDTITTSQMVNLKNIYNSIRDGMSSPNDWFEGSENGANENPEALEKTLAAIDKAASKAEVDIVLTMIDGLGAADQKQARAKWMAKVAELKQQKVTKTTVTGKKPAAEDKSAKPKPTAAPKEEALDPNMARDWRVEIAACKTKDSLKQLLNEIPEGVYMELNDFIDESFDAMRG